MRSKRVKNYWVKCKESFTDGKAATSRAKTLRINEQVTHVTVDQTEDTYFVRYSVARWYHEQIKELGIQL